MHGGVKFYRGSAGAARSSRPTVHRSTLNLAEEASARYVATPTRRGYAPGGMGGRGGTGCGMGGPAYEWVAGYDVETGQAKGRLRQDKQGLRFVEVVVNRPEDLVAGRGPAPEIASAYDVAQERAAVEIIGWLAAHATTRVGPRGRQVQVPVEKLEAAVVRHYTSRAGDPHRHLHLQINARVFAAGAWRGLHSVGVVDSIEAINGIGHAAVMCDPEFRGRSPRTDTSLDPTTGEVASSRRHRVVQRPRRADHPQHRPLRGAVAQQHPDQEPGPTLRRAWDRRAWSAARPDKVAPVSGDELRQRWVEELHHQASPRPWTWSRRVEPTVGGGRLAPPHPGGSTDHRESTSWPTRYASTPVENWPSAPTIGVPLLAVTTYPTRPVPDLG